MSLPLPLSVEEFKLALPEKVKKSVNQELIDRVNAVLAEPEMFEVYRDNLLSYAKVMADGRFKVTDYLNAVKYVSHKVMGCSNIDAYRKTFPDKMDRFDQQGVSAKDIASYVSAYNKGQLVNKIFEQTLIPSYILNQDLYQKAINRMADLMMNAKSEKVQGEMANALATQLKPPEVKKVELAVGVTESSAISALRDATMQLVAQQKQAILAGVQTAEQTAHSSLVFDTDGKEITE